MRIAGFTVSTAACRIAANACSPRLPFFIAFCCCFLKCTPHFLALAQLLWAPQRFTFFCFFANVPRNVPLNVPLNVPQQNNKNNNNNNGLQDSLVFKKYHFTGGVSKCFFRVFVCVCY